MSKKKRKNRKARKRNVATGQVKKHPPPAIRQRRIQGGSKADLMEQGYSTTDVRSDLRKTAILTAVCLVILLALYFTQSRWSGVLK